MSDHTSNSRDISGDHNVGGDQHIGGHYAGRDLHIHEHAAPPPGTNSLHQLRPPVGDFVGREQEIDQLKTALRSGSNAAISGISGLGGIGKTELALKVAQELCGNYPNAQLLLDMRGTDDPPRDPGDALATAIRALAGPETQLPESTEERAAMYRSLLDTKRALVVLDNAADSNQARPLLPPKSCGLIITSRSRLTLPGLESLVLEQLSLDEAKALLINLCARIRPEIADTIAKLCGCLPLALRAAGSLLDVTIDLDPVEYARELQDERTRLEQLGQAAEEAELPTSVEASLNLSYQRLWPEAATIFCRLSVFPESFDAKAEESICEDHKHRILSKLVRRNLVYYSDTVGRYRLHDLTRLFAQGCLPRVFHSTLQQRHTVHYLHVLQNVEILYEQGGTNIEKALGLIDTEWLNIQAGYKWIKKQNITESNDTLLIRYTSVAPDVLALRLPAQDSLRWWQSDVEACRRLKNRKMEGMALGNLANAYQRLGDMRQAIALLYDALVIHKEVKDRKSEAMTLGNLAAAHTALGNSHVAINLLQDALPILREEKDRKGEGLTLGSLGNAYFLLGEYQRSIELLEQQLDIARKTGDHRGEGIALGNLGNTYLGMGNLDRAASLIEGQLRIACDLKDERLEAWARGCLGNVYLESGNSERALAYYEEQLMIARETGDRSIEGMALCNIGAANRVNGSLNDALRFLKQAVTILRQVGVQQGEAMSLWNISLTLHSMGEKIQAMSAAENALQIFGAIESPKAMVVRNQLDEWHQER
jgi:tetratricopeptide (TPR) repeat protein